MARQEGDGAMEPGRQVGAGSKGRRAVQRQLQGRAAAARGAATGMALRMAALPSQRRQGKPSPERSVPALSSATSTEHAARHTCSRGSPFGSRAVAAVLRGNCRQAGTCSSLGAAAMHVSFIRQLTSHTKLPRLLSPVRTLQQRAGTGQRLPLRRTPCTECTNHTHLSRTAPHHRRLRSIPPPSSPPSQNGNSKCNRGSQLLPASLRPHVEKRPSKSVALYPTTTSMRSPITDS